MVQAHRTSSNLLEPHHCKVCRVLSHELGVFRLYRTFYIYIVTGETRYEGWLCTSSGWFKHIVPRRTFSNHIITEIVRCVEFCHMSFRSSEAIPYTWLSCECTKGKVFGEDLTTMLVPYSYSLQFHSYSFYSFTVISSKIV